jgi:hypothetical protein
VRRERALGRDRTGDGIPGPRKRVEERVALSVDLGPALGSEVLPEEQPVIANDVSVLVTKLLEQTSRPLDIGEEEGDRAARK